MRIFDILAANDTAQDGETSHFAVPVDNNRIPRKGRVFRIQELHPSELREGGEFATRQD